MEGYEIERIVMGHDDGKDAGEGLTFGFVTKDGVFHVTAMFSRTRDERGTGTPWECVGNGITQDNG